MYNFKGCQLRLPPSLKDFDEMPIGTTSLSITEIATVFTLLHTQYYTIKFNIFRVLAWPIIDFLVYDRSFFIANIFFVQISIICYNQCLKINKKGGYYAEMQKNLYSTI